MAEKYEVYWYRKDPAVAKAFLYHCRDRDLRPGDGIARGSIVQGVGGFAVAESDVPGLAGDIVSAFRSNRKCEWMGFTLPCMAHPQAPAGTATKKELRPYNNVIAALTDPAAVQQAATANLSVITHADGTNLINLEISVFEAQGNSSPRRAKLQ
jgi:hypothetical protein